MWKTADAAGLSSLAGSQRGPESSVWGRADPVLTSDIKSPTARPPQLPTYRQRVETFCFEDWVSYLGSAKKEERGWVVPRSSGGQRMKTTGRVRARCCKAAPLVTLPARREGVRLQRCGRVIGWCPLRREMMLDRQQHTVCVNGDMRQT
jgi:hypothetical protein